MDTSAFITAILSKQSVFSSGLLITLFSYTRRYALLEITLSVIKITFKFYKS